MRVYVDTGIFIDYLSPRGLTTPGLRSTGRRGRSLEQVLGDAERVLDRIARRHEGATSVLTYYEVEEALYKSLAAGGIGTTYAERYRVVAARAIVPLTMVAVELFNIQVLDLTTETIDVQIRTVELQTQGVRAADALHLATASRWSADVVVTTDGAIERLDNKVRNKDGKFMRCRDSDQAIRNL